MQETGKTDGLNYKSFTTWCLLDAFVFQLVANSQDMTMPQFWIRMRRLSFVQTDQILVLVMNHCQVLHKALLKVFLQDTERQHQREPHSSWGRSSPYKTHDVSTNGFLAASHLCLELSVDCHYIDVARCTWGPELSSKEQSLYYIPNTYIIL